MGSCEVEGETIAVGRVPVAAVVVVVVIQVVVVVVRGPVVTGGRGQSSISARLGAEGVRRVILFPGDPALSSKFPELLT